MKKTKLKSKNKKSKILNSRRAGFTLIEVLVASAILAIILAALYSTFFLSHKAIAGLDESMLKLQECRAALDILRREIDSCFYRNGDKNTIFKLEDRDIYGKQTSRIVFTAFSPVRAGVSEIKYHVKESDDGLTLYKEISAPFGSKNKIQEADIIEGVGEFIIEGKTGGKWVKTWDSTLVNRLPEEVKISLKVKIKGRDVLLSATARPVIT